MSETVGDCRGLQEKRKNRGEPRLYLKTGAETGGP